MATKQETIRDTLVTVRVTKEERALVIAQAAQAGRSISDLFRERFDLPANIEGSKAS